MTSEYAKQRARVRALVNRYVKQGYVFTTPIVPKIPKNKTQASIDKLKRITPEYVQKKAKIVNTNTGELVKAKFKRRKKDLELKAHKPRLNSGNPANLVHKGNPANLVHKGNPKNLVHKGNAKNLVHKGNPKNLVHKGNAKNLVHKGNAKNLVHKGRPKGSKDKKPRQQYHTKSYWVLKNFLQRIDMFNNVDTGAGGNFAYNFFHSLIEMKGEDAVAEYIDRAIRHGQEEFTNGFDSEQILFVSSMAQFILDFIEINELDTDDVMEVYYELFKGYDDEQYGDADTLFGFNNDDDVKPDRGNTVSSKMGYKKFESEMKNEKS